VLNRPINDHDYDSPSLEVAYAGNIRKNMPHICGICSIYVAYMCHIFHQIPHIFLHILPQKVPHILRKFSAINQHPEGALENFISTAGELELMSTKT